MLVLYRAHCLAQSQELRAPVMREQCFRMCILAHAQADKDVHSLHSFYLHAVKPELVSATGHCWMISMSRFSIPCQRKVIVIGNLKTFSCFKNFED